MKTIQKRHIVLLATTMIGSVIAAENMGVPAEYGTIKGRLQTVSMWRDYERAGDSNFAHSLGLQLDYTSPEKAGFTGGLSYIGAGVLDAGDNGVNPGQNLLLNGRMNVMNEIYGQFRFSAFDATNTYLIVGRKAFNGEVFRYTEARQKKRATEGIFLQSSDIPNTKVMVGHSTKLSNIYGHNNPGLSANYEDYGDVLNYDGKSADGFDSEGLSWGEAVYSKDAIELAAYEAYVWNVANLFGGRGKIAISEDTSIIGHYRNESGTGDNGGHAADSYCLALEQKIAGATIEVGYFGVYGDKLLAEENTTGINHPLNYSLILDTLHFNGGSDTAYLKAVKKVNGTVFYTLLNATWHSKLNFDGQEANFVVKHPLTDVFTICFKGGIGLRQYDNGNHDTQTDGRIFMTYTF